MGLGPSFEFDMVLSHCIKRANLAWEDTGLRLFVHNTGLARVIVGLMLVLHHACLLYVYKGLSLIAGEVVLVGLMQSFHGADLWGLLLNDHSVGLLRFARSSGEEGLTFVPTGLVEQ